MPFIVLIFEFVLLFLLSKIVILKLSKLFYYLTKNYKLTVILLSIICFPGTIIHEFAHYVFAKILLVRTGKIVLLPTFNGNAITLGSVEMARSNIFFRTLIGFAPVLIGTIVITLFVYILESNLYFHTYLWYGILGFIIFSISNSMFSSRKDLEGLTFYLVLLFLSIVFLFIFEKNLFLLYLLPLLNPLFTHVATYLLIPLIIDISIILLMYLLSFLITI